MPFNYLGTMRESQYQAFRRFSLRERKAVLSRVRYINSEINKIGRITVIYDRKTESVQTPSGALEEVTTVSERRVGLLVSSGSTLEKLLQVYISMGGNPNSISMFLQPDELQFRSNLDPNEDPDSNPNKRTTDKGIPEVPFDQPGGGVISAESTDSYGSGGLYRGGRANTLRDPYTKIGRYIDLSDSNAKIAIKMDYARRWVRQEIKELGVIESKIIKLMDLREQLVQERDVLIKQAIGGSVTAYPTPPDPTRFSRQLNLTEIVTEFDGVFYERGENGVPDFSTINLGTRDNPSGISLYDTLFGNDPDEDPFSHG
jgi:hypothetical protein